MAEDVVRHKVLPVPVDPNAGPKGLPRRLRLIVLAVWLLVSIAAGFVAATQLVAHKLHYHPELTGLVWRSQDKTMHLYTPWSFVVWQVELGSRIPRALEYGLGGFLATGLLFGLGALALRNKQANALFAHGSARWATPEEIKAIGLISDKGVVLGKHLTGELLSHDGPEHVMVFAPTRSGKGVGLVLPTLWQWTGSTVVLDLKGENFDMTAGFRSRFSHVLRFEPTSPRSASFNPLQEVRLGTTNEIRDAQNIAQILCDPGTASGDSSHWVDSAADILSGIILHVLYAEQDKSLAGVNSFLKNPERTLEQTFERMMKFPHLGDTVHPFIAESARAILNKADKERSGIISSVLRPLRLWTDPLIARATSRSDFKLADLMAGEHPTSLYLVVPPSDTDRLRPLVRMIITQLVRGQLETLTQRDHRLLMLLDEFPALGKLSFIQEALAYVAGYGIKMFIIAQDLKQMEEVYGKANTILSNCNVRVAFAPSDDETAGRISQMLGTATWHKKQEAESGKKGLFGLENQSRSTLEYARPLLTAAEVANLDVGWEFILVTGKPPIVTPKVRYYEDARFKARVLDPPATWRDTPRACVHCLARIRQQEAALKAATLPPKQLEEAAQGHAQAVAQRMAAPAPSAPPETSLSIPPRTAAPGQPSQQDSSPRLPAPVPVTEEPEGPPIDVSASPVLPAVSGTAAPAAMQQEEEQEAPREEERGDKEEAPPQHDAAPPLSISFDMDDPFGPEAQDEPEGLSDEPAQDKQPARSGDGWLM